MSANDWHKLDTGALKKRGKYKKTKTAAERMERYRVAPEDALQMTAGVEHFAGTTALPKTGYDLYAACAALEETLIRRALRDFGGNTVLAARFIGINRTTLYEKCKKLGIDVNTYREIRRLRVAAFGRLHAPETATHHEP